MTNRLLPITKGYNFRDLGGYQTTSGKKVKWRRLLRSGKLADLDSQDLMILTDFNLVADIDLRSPAEVKTDPDHYPSQTKYYFNPIFDTDKTRSSKGLAGYGPKADVEPNVGYHHMKNVYHEMITFPSGQAAFKKLFEIALSLNDDESLIFHCTAGKDRTGVSAALLLATLGVPKATIQADYLLSNQTTKTIIDKMVQQIKASGRNDFFLQNFRAVAGVNLDYLNEAFNTIDNQCGGLEEFLTTTLGLSRTDLQDFRVKFTQ